MMVDTIVVAFLRDTIDIVWKINSMVKLNSFECDKGVL